MDLFKRGRVIALQSKDWAYLVACKTDVPLPCQVVEVQCCNAIAIEASLMQEQDTYSQEDRLVHDRVNFPAVSASVFPS